MHKLLIILSFLLSLGIAPAFAAEAKPVSDDPALELRVQRLANELRCLVCQNQTIADSNAELAVDLRNQVREQLRQGKSEEEILAYMVQRYGDFVRYRPPVKMQTLVLWIGPFLLLAGGVVALMRHLRRRRQMPESDDVPQAQLDQAANILRGKEEGR
jgi:cytochrome c-type biogenesis protein CcmH